MKEEGRAGRGMQIRGEHGVREGGSEGGIIKGGQGGEK